MSKGPVLAIVFVLLIFTLVLVFYRQNTIGGDRDSHGCLIGGGYSFDRYIGACTRNWEIDEDYEKNVAIIAINSVKNETEVYSLTVLDVVEKECEGCFEVLIENNEKKFKVLMENMEVISYAEVRDMISIQKCIEKKGRIVSVLGDRCTKKEIDSGRLEGFLSPHICCISI